MSILTYLQHLFASDVQQPLPGQVPNSDGGFVWPIGKEQRLRRFLILGTEGGTYYASERKLTAENAACILDFIADDGLRTVATIVEIAESGRAPKPEPAILALALCLKMGDNQTKAAVREVLPRVCRTGTHLFAFAEAVKAIGGWGPAVQKSIARYYVANEPDKLVYHAVKYQQRNGWSHRDLLRLCHIKPPTPEHGAIYRYMVKGWDGPLPDAPSAALPGQLWAFEKAKQAKVAGEVLPLIRDFALPREAIPTHFLNDVAVWDALLHADMPLTALLRNLSKMTAVGLLSPGSVATSRVIARLSDAEALKRARVHPLAVLVALRTYASGHGARGQLSWQPVASITNALNKAFYRAFGTITPTQKRWMLGLDVSGSMTWGEIAGLPGITPRIAAAAMSMVAARIEGAHQLLGFCDKLVSLPITASMSIDAVCKAMDNLPFGATNPGLLFEYALKQRIPVDVFAIYTDNEVNQGQHPAVLLERYRQQMGIDAKLIVVGLTATPFSVGDPNDLGTLNVVGFDTAAPELMASFVRGEL